MLVQKKKIRIDGEMPAQTKVAAGAGAASIKNAPVHVFNGGEGKSGVNTRKNSSPQKQLRKGADFYVINCERKSSVEIRRPEEQDHPAKPGRQVC